MCIRYELDVVWRGWEMQLVPRHIMRWEKEKGGGGHQWRTGERGRLQAHSRLYFTPQQSLFYTTAVSILHHSSLSRRRPSVRPLCLAPWASGVATGLTSGAHGTRTRYNRTRIGEV